MNYPPWYFSNEKQGCNALDAMYTIFSFNHFVVMYHIMSTHSTLHIILYSICMYFYVFMFVFVIHLLLWNCIVYHRQKNSLIISETHKKKNIMYAQRSGIDSQIWLFIHQHNHSYVQATFDFISTLKSCLN